MVHVTPFETSVDGKRNLWLPMYFFLSFEDRNRITSMYFVVLVFWMNLDPIINVYYRKYQFKEAML